ncbi:acetyltransferase [Rhypophila sp. PSN 637]
MAATTTITELDLSACHPSSIVDKINAVPGLKTSAAFFTFLRANLVLPHSAMSSNVSTPYLEPQHSSSAAPLPASLSTSKSTSSSPPASQKSTNPPLDDDIPPLSLEVLTTQPEKVDALRLIADSIAQQRQLASFSLVFHPLLLSLLIASLACVYQYAWAARQDLGITLTLGSGTIMTYLLAIRYVVSPYIAHAESLKYDFLTNPDTNEDDVVIATRWNKELIGATVLRLEPSSSSSHHHPSSPSPSKRRSKAQNLKGGKGVIRAWTTKLRYRGRGVGGDMLAEAVRITKEKCGRDGQVGFAKEHANAKMVLPEFFNGVFRKGERRAALALEKVLSEVSSSGRGKR